MFDNNIIKTIQQTHNFNRRIKQFSVELCMIIFINKIRLNLIDYNLLLNTNLSQILGRLGYDRIRLML